MLKTQMASRQGSHWFIESPTIIHLCVKHTSEKFVNFALNIMMPLAYTQSEDNLFHSCIVLYENYYLIYTVPMVSVCCATHSMLACYA